MRKAIIKAENLTKIYKDGQNEIKALDDLNFSFYEGEFVVILGPSGAGKSTLLHILGGMKFQNILIKSLDYFVDLK